MEQEDNLDENREQKLVVQTIYSCNIRWLCLGKVKQRTEGDRKRNVYAIAIVISLRGKPGKFSVLHL